MKYYLAPMEGLTTYNFRRTWHKYYGGMDRYFTPFLANRHMNSRERNDVLPEHNVGMEVVPQILTNRADEFLELAEQLAGYGYKCVNLNLGCPSGTVVARNRGAGFLRIPAELEKFLDEIFEKCPLGISVKTRIGMEDVAEYVDRIIVMNKGSVMYDDTPREVFKHYKELEEVGLAAPQVTYIMHELKARGADVDVDATTIEEAAEEIARVWKQNNQK